MFWGCVNVESLPVVQQPLQVEPHFPGVAVNLHVLHLSQNDFRTVKRVRLHMTAEKWFSMVRPIKSTTLSSTDEVENCPCLAMQKVCSCARLLIHCLAYSRSFFFYVHCHVLAFGKRPTSQRKALN